MRSENPGCLVDEISPANQRWEEAGIAGEPMSSGIYLQIPSNIAFLKTGIPKLSQNWYS